MKANKIILGCANLGQKYGIRDKSLKINEFKKIYKFALKKKIFYFDTAADYGNSEKLLGQIKSSSNKKTFFITKLPKKKYSNFSKEIEISIRNSLSRLNKKNIFGIHVHDPQLLINKNKFKVYKALQSAKQKKLIKHIGVSVYEIQEIKKILKFFKIDIIQIPLNILDNRFLKGGFLKKLKKKVKEIHARSIFLKGLLLKDSLSRPKYFDRWKLLKNVDFFFKKNKIDRLQYCVNYVLNIKEVDRIVIGISSKKQLSNILNIKKRRGQKLPIFTNQNVVDKRLLIPKYWKI